MWELTAKRKENLVKFCVSAFTVDLAGIVFPYLQGQRFSVTIIASGLVAAFFLVIFSYLLER